MRLLSFFGRQFLQFIIWTSYSWFVGCLSQHIMSIYCFEDHPHHKCNRPTGGNPSPVPQQIHCLSLSASWPPPPPPPLQRTRSSSPSSSPSAPSARAQPRPPPISVSLFSLLHHFESEPPPGRRPQMNHQSTPSANSPILLPWRERQRRSKMDGSQLNFKPCWKVHPYFLLPASPISFFDSNPDDWFKD